MAQPHVTLYYDVVCPFAYLASTQARRIVEAAGGTLSWKPMLLGGLFNALHPEGSPRPPVPEARHLGNARDLDRWARRYGVELRFPEAHPRRTVDAMRLLAAAELQAIDVLEPLTHALYRAYWADGADVTHRAVLTALAEQHGLDGGVIDREDVKAHLRRNTEQAVAEGIFGAPSFVVEGPAGRRMIFGQDRLDFVARAIRGTLGEPSLSRAPRVPATGRRVTFFFDYSSPYTYLASTQIERVAAEVGATIEWRPILLGALFKTIGNAVVPIQAASVPRRRYLNQDLDDWAAHWAVPFRFASRFPMMTVLPLRMTLALPLAQRTPLIHALFRAYWVEDRDISDAAVLLSVASELGLDGAALLEGATSPDVKAALSANTTSASEAGVYGLPSFLVDDQLYFGQDRLDFVAEALRST